MKWRAIFLSLAAGAVAGAAHSVGNQVTTEAAIPGAKPWNGLAGPAIAGAVVGILTAAFSGVVSKQAS